MQFCVLISMVPFLCMPVQHWGRTLAAKIQPFSWLYLMFLVYFSKEFPLMLVTQYFFTLLVMKKNPLIIFLPQNVTKCPFLVAKLLIFLTQWAASALDGHAWKWYHWNQRAKLHMLLCLFKNISEIVTAYYSISNCHANNMQLFDSNCIVFSRELSM